MGSHHESPDADFQFNALASVVASVVTALEQLNRLSRFLHPRALSSLLGEVSEADVAVREEFQRFADVPCPAGQNNLKQQLEIVVHHVGKAFDDLRACSGDDPNDVFKAYQALKSYPRAVEALYPLAQVCPVVSRYFIEPEKRHDDVLEEKLASVPARGNDTGIIHIDNARASRGGFSVYIPEYYDPDEALPLIMVLHGGSGHGADFLWSWIREARTRRALLASPTALGRTWSLMGDDVDSQNLSNIVDYLCNRWPIDRSRMLLTGMSDGGTYTYLNGLCTESPFTHLAPCSASFHPVLLSGFEEQRIENLPIYIIHGVQDWMFPISMAREANKAFAKAKAKVVYREIKDLSHTYPRDENPRIMDWFLDGDGKILDG